MYYAACRECGTTERRHIARGLCGPCYDRLARIDALPDKEPRAWSPYAPCCLRCNTVKRTHARQGLCIKCYKDGLKKIPELRPRYREYAKKYRRSQKHRDAQRKYQLSEKGKLVMWRANLRKRERRAGFNIDIPVGYRELVVEQFGFCCANCGLRGHLILDHHWPLRLGFPLLHNAVPLCESCNAGKQAIPPQFFYDKKKLRRIARVLQRIREMFDERFSAASAI